jgi:hypothetical protein
LIQVNAVLGRSIIFASFPAEHPMTTNESYYLILVCLAFGSFGLSLAAACLRYRGWLARSPQSRA